MLETAESGRRADGSPRGRRRTSSQCSPWCDPLSRAQHSIRRVVVVVGRHVRGGGGRRRGSWTGGGPLRGGGEERRGGFSLRPALMPCKRYLGLGLGGRGWGGRSGLATWGGGRRGGTGRARVRDAHGLGRARGRGSEGTGSKVLLRCARPRRSGSCR
jgi:hypothetical protein